MYISLLVGKMARRYYIISWIHVLEWLLFFSISSMKIKKGTSTFMLRIGIVSSIIFFRTLADLFNFYLNIVCSRRLFFHILTKYDIFYLVSIKNFVFYSFDYTLYNLIWAPSPTDLYNKRCLLNWFYINILIKQLE